ncbi:hypothetical protein [Liquorilactobacillus sicerae]|uniref:hypothetical protein n=1 Tax=Liquorilactobacillus sicerae TaxID=1416943 RepID=UPI002480D0C2|nr:hypothetical protein [Liquorilactobacillus sicerae]
MRLTELVGNVLNQACETRTVKAGLILHTDLGSQYRSFALETSLKQTRYLALLQ